MKQLISIVCTLAISIAVHAAQLDFGDHTSTTITTKAWEAFNAGRHDDAIGYANKCIELYQTKAEEMQKTLTAPVPSDQAEEVSKQWALNDVGTCLFILGQSLEKQNKGTEALAAYKKLAEKLSFAQTWDTKGWFWKPADAAKERIKALEFDTLK
jgi:tetratricopeptide (TPR) repeat protein